MLVGSAIQGVAGFGSNLFAAPLLVIVDPDLVPGPLIIAAVALNVLILGANRGTNPWRTMAWANVGQVFGGVAGALVLGAIAADQLSMFFAVMILAAVALGASGFAPHRTPRTMAAAGALSGFMGTSVGIGGPAIALVQAGSEGDELRAALSRFFLLGTAVSLLALTAVGRFGWEDLATGLLLVPGTVAGYLLSRPLAPRVNRRTLRVVVLVLSSVAAAVALLRALL